MLWFNKHARLRHKLSPYIDDQLTASETAALEAHLASCDACHRRLDELRATVSALHEQPQAEAPRSFVITPGMLDRKSAAAARPLPALGLGMRLAGAGVAVALAVVVVGDLTLGDNGGASPQAGSQPAEESRVVEMFSDADTSKSSESGAYSPPSGNADSSTTQSNAGAAAPCPPAAAPQATGGGAAGGAGTTAGRGAGETPAPAATQQPVPSSTSSPESPNVAAICGNASGGAAAPVAPQTPENAAPRAAAADNGGGGISTLRIAEIALAGVLIAILAAIVLEAAMRRRRIA